MAPAGGVMITNLSTCKTSPKWTFRPRAQSARNANTPGPGTHGVVDPSSHGKYSRAPSYGFGSSVRDAIRPGTTPGPGQYMAFDSTKMAAPNYGFGSSTRDVAAGRRALTPGPGTYAPSYLEMGSEGPKYTATPKRFQNDRSSTPGPGAYQPSKGSTSEILQSPRWGFGTSERNGTSRASTPGPGAYSQTGTLGGGPKYSMKPRRDMKTNTANALGPGVQTTQFGY